VLEKAIPAAAMSASMNLATKIMRTIAIPKSFNALTTNTPLTDHHNQNGGCINAR
jgi:hypothetical protein